MHSYLEEEEVSMKNVLGFKSIKSKLLSAFSIVIALVILLGLYNVWVINKSNAEAKNIVETELPMLIANEELALSMANRIATARGYVLYGGDFKNRFNDYTEIGKQNEEVIRGIRVSDEFEKIMERTIEWRQQVAAEVFDEYDKGNEEQALKNLAAIDDTAREIMAAYEQMAKESQQIINDIEAEIVASGESTLFVVSGITVLVIIISIIAAFVTSSIISKPIKMVMDRMVLIAKGDLSSKPLETNAQDEVGQLVVATNDMSVQINEILSGTLQIAHQVNQRSANLTEATGAVSDSSNQIAATMEQLAAGSEAQAHTASNMAEMVGNFFEDVQNANAAGSEVATASNTVLERTATGNAMMTSSVEQMDAIYQIVNESVEEIQKLDNQTKEISELVTVISEIAEQTNLLALNAAIEAARAGEEGKGFAVVAEEVKKLAEQVADSVRGITTIVDTVQEGSSSAVRALETGYAHVTDGQEKIANTGHIFEEITKLVTNMNKLTDTMSADLNNIEQVGSRLTDGVTEVASIAEESAAGVEETTASVEQTTFQIDTISESAEELAQLSADLETSVNQFTIADSGQQK